MPIEAERGEQGLLLLWLAGHTSTCYGVAANTCRLQRQGFADLQLFGRICCGLDALQCCSNNTPHACTAAFLTAGLW
jgi:hypothetical protein